MTAPPSEYGTSQGRPLSTPVHLIVQPVGGHFLSLPAVLSSGEETFYTTHEQNKRQQGRRTFAGAAPICPVAFGCTCTR